MDIRLDVTGLCCPLPLVRLRKLAGTLEQGQQVVVIGNDPIFESSIRDYCQAHGHAVLDVAAQAGDAVAMTLRIGG
jgi:tRNA 2-thiouridine synthesizing protein A